MKVVMIGCTHAGTAAAKNILRLYPEAELSIYERNDNISFLSCGIALYVGGVVKDPEGLFYSSPEELKELGAQVHMEHDVLNVDSKAKTVEVKDLKTGQVLTKSYDKLIVTTGSWPVIPPIEGIDKENILLCKNFGQAQEIIEKAKSARKITIVGGGYIGIELVEAFVESGKEVTLIDGLDRILNRYLDQEFTAQLEKELAEKGVRLALDQTVTRFDGDGKVSSVVTSKGNYATDLVILCVGFKPSTQLVKDQVEQLPNGAIIVDKYMRSSNPDIFAAGDSAIVHFNPANQAAYIPLATNAVRQGLLVAENLMGDKMAYRGTQGTSGLKLFGTNIASSGVTESSASMYGLEVDAVYLEDNYRPEFMPTTEKVCMKLVYEKATKRIVGGQLMSTYDITQSANTLSLAIENKMTIEDLALSDFFFQPHYDRPWNYLNILAQEAMLKEKML